MITPLYAGLLTVLLVVLFARVVRLRWKYKVGLGDGGEKELQRAIRVHGNFVETVPWAILLMLMMDLTHVRPLWLHVYGCLLIVARLSHAWGVTHHSTVSWGRTVGVSLTLSLMGCAAVYCVWQYFG